MNPDQIREIRKLSKKALVTRYCWPNRCLCPDRRRCKSSHHDGYLCGNSAIGGPHISGKSKLAAVRNVTSAPTLQLGEAIDSLEKSMRDRIDLVLSAKSDDYLSLVPSDILQSVQQKINEHLKRHPYEKKLKIPNRRRLDYMDIMDYCKIILTNWNCFEERFGSGERLRTLLKC